MEQPVQQVPKKQSPPKISSFKGNPVIILNPEDKWPFSFGMGKAKLILQNLDAIRSFVESEITEEQKA